MQKNKIRVAISGFSGLDNPEPGNAVARTLRYDLGNSIEIEGLTYDVWSSGAWPPGLIDRLHLMPPLSSGDQITLNRILEIHDKRPIAPLFIVTIIQLYPRFCIAKAASIPA